MSENHIDLLSSAISSNSSVEQIRGMKAVAALTTMPNDERMNLVADVLEFTAEERMRYGSIRNVGRQAFAIIEFAKEEGLIAELVSALEPKIIEIETSSSQSHSR